jgi:hypothetical protein
MGCGGTAALALPRRLGQMVRMLHLAKLAVGIRDLAHLRQVQAERASINPPLRHLTRNHPRRAAEVLDGGSIYWVIGGAMLLRQRVLDITAEAAADGEAVRTALVLDPLLVALAGRACRAFQGWRYLEPAAAPPDLASNAAPDAEALPPALQRELRRLGLL